MLRLICQTATTPDRRRYTAITLANLNNHQQIIDFLKSYAELTNDLIFERIKEDNPSVLKILQETGYSFTEVHSVTTANALHYAASGQCPANLIWIWNQLPVEQQSTFLLARVQFGTPENLELLTPLQIAQKLGLENYVRILHALAIRLAGTTDSRILQELSLAGYDLSATDNAGYSAFYYAISKNKVENLEFLFNLMNIQDAVWLNILHFCVTNENKEVLEWVAQKLPPAQMLRLLCQTVTTPDGRPYTVVSLATLNNKPQIMDFLKSYAVRTNDFLYERIKEDNPNTLKSLKEIGYSFTNIHSVTSGNALHYAILGKCPANLIWIWNRLAVEQKSAFLLAKIQHGTEGNHVLLNPLQLAQKLGLENYVRILHGLVIKLTGIVDPTILQELSLAGYNFLATDGSGCSALYYAILGNKVENVKHLFSAMYITEIVAHLNRKLIYLNGNLQERQQTPLQIAEEHQVSDIANLFTTYMQLSWNFSFLRQNVLHPDNQLPANIPPVPTPNFFLPLQNSRIISRNSPGIENIGPNRSPAVQGPSLLGKRSDIDN